jgi:hypothetical protein
MLNPMKRVYFSPVMETILMNPASVLCASGGTGTPFGVDNTPTDDLIIS